MTKTMELFKQPKVGGGTGEGQAPQTNTRLFSNSGLDGNDFETFK